MLHRVGMLSGELINLQFLLICLSASLFLMSFYMVLPELPAYLDSLGGGAYKGWIIAFFSISAGLIRPLSGKLADLVGRKTIMMLGAIIATLCGALYAFALGVAGFFLVRLLHGLSAGFKPTGDTALIADIIPMHLRGEALGLLGVSSSIGMALGPVLGSAIAMEYGMDALFFASAIIAGLCSLTVFFVDDDLNTQRFKIKMIKVAREDIFELRVLPPAIIMFLTVFTLGLALTIVPDFAVHVGVSNKGLFFTIMLVASMLVRLFAGKASDQLGRVALLKVACALLGIAMLVMAFAPNLWWLYAGAILYGLSNGITSPTLLAWAVDLALPEKRGRGMATLYISLELGVMLGALVSAAIYQNQAGNFIYCFLLAALLAFAGLAYLLLRPNAEN